MAERGKEIGKQKEGRKTAGETAAIENGDNSNDPPTSEAEVADEKKPPKTQTIADVMNW